MVILKVASAFWSGLTAPRACAAKEHCHHEKKMRDHLSEDQLDRMLMETCDASDPITMY